MQTLARKVRDQDYQRDLKNELLGLPIQKRLKPTAVPSLKLTILERYLRRKVEFVEVPSIDVEVHEKGRRKTKKVPDGGGEVEFIQEHEVDKEFVEVPTIDVKVREKGRKKAKKVLDGDIQFIEEHNCGELLNKYETVTKENEEIKKELDDCKTKIAKLENDLVKIGSQFMLEKERRIQMENALKHLCNVSEIKLLIVE